MASKWHSGDSNSNLLISSPEYFPLKYIGENEEGADDSKKEDT